MKSFFFDHFRNKRILLNWGSETNLLEANIYILGYVFRKYLKYFLQNTYNSKEKMYFVKLENLVSEISVLDKIKIVFFKDKNFLWIFPLSIFSAIINWDNLGFFLFFCFFAIFIFLYFLTLYKLINHIDILKFILYKYEKEYSKKKLKTYA